MYTELWKCIEWTFAKYLSKIVIIIILLQLFQIIEENNSKLKDWMD